MSEKEFRVLPLGTKFKLMDSEEVYQKLGDCGSCGNKPTAVKLSNNEKVKIPSNTKVRVVE